MSITGQVNRDLLFSTRPGGSLRPPGTPGLTPLAAVHVTAMKPREKITGLDAAKGQFGSAALGSQRISSLCSHHDTSIPANRIIGDVPGRRTIF
jgi:hypothetical protein